MSDAPNGPFQMLSKIVETNFTRVPNTGYVSLIVLESDLAMARLELLALMARLEQVGD